MMPIVFGAMKMQNTLLFGALIVLQMTLVSSLTCATGFELDSDLVMETTWNITECRSDVPQLCQRKDVTLVGFEILEIYVATGDCVNASVCNEPCEAFIDDLLTSGNTNSTPDLRQFSPRRCQITCCPTDNCNKPLPFHSNSKVTSTTSSSANFKEPSAVESSKTTPSIDEPPFTSQSTTTVSSLRCSRGYEVADNALINWDSAQCSPNGNSACFKQEVTLMNAETKEKFSIYIGSCVKERVCNDPCNDLAMRLITTSRLADVNNSSLNFANASIESCEQACCRHSNCNKYSVNQIRKDESGGTMASVANKLMILSFSLLCVSYFCSVYQ